MILQLLTLIGALGMFLYGMNMMSAGLQKAAGERLRNFLSAMTSNRVKGVGTGLLITSIIQSSSATTVMVVGFVNAGLLALGQAIGVIMGANIGTTVTAWLISLLGFKMDISVVAVPIMAIGFVMSLSKKEKYKNISEFVMGFALLFLGLALMKNSVPDLQQTPEVLSFIAQWTEYGFGSVLIFLLLGTALTLVLQSSSATMALTLIMMSLGWIPFEMAAAMVLGENIGTTITANIAASVANTNAKRAAMAHTVFNVFGVIWALALFGPFLQLVGIVIASMGYPNPTELNYTGSLQAGSDESTAALYGVSMLHTLFNLFNTCILIWFVPQIERLVTWIIKDKPADPEDEFAALKYIQMGPLGTTELAFGQAQKELVHFAEVSKKGLSYARQAIQTEKGGDLEKFTAKLNKYEAIADDLQYKIADFLEKIPIESLNENTAARLQAYYKIISELESLGDSGENIGRILTRRNQHGQRFNEKNLERITTLLDLTDQAYDVMIENLAASAIGKKEMDKAYACEEAINAKRNEYRDKELSHIERPQDGYSGSVYFIDIISEIEHMGDFIINVSQALDFTKPVLTKKTVTTKK